MAEETLFTDIINNLGKTKIKAQGSGSKSGKTGFISTGDRSAIQLPKGITSDSQKIDITANVTAPVTDKFSILGDIQYNKFRDKIEKGDQELFLQDAPSNIDRKVGIGYNEGGEGFSGYAKYGIDSEKPEYFVQYKKSFKDGGSTNGSADKAFTGKVKELMEDGYEFGEAVKEAMRQGYAKGGGVKSFLNESDFIREFTARRINGDMNAIQFIKYLNENYSSSPQAKKGFTVGNIDTRLRKAQAKGLISKDVVYKGSKLDLQLTPEKYKSVLGEEEYNKIMKEDPTKLKDRYEYKRNKKNIPNFLDVRKKRTKEWKASLTPDELREKVTIPSLEYKQKKFPTKFTVYRDNPKSLAWKDLVSRTYEYDISEKKSKGKPYFKFETPIESGKNYNTEDMKKIVLVDKKDNRFTQDTLFDDVKKVASEQEFKSFKNTYDQKAFMNKDGITTELNRLYEITPGQRKSVFNIQHIEGFNKNPFKIHMTFATENADENKFRKKFDTDFEKASKIPLDGKGNKGARFIAQKNAINNYYKSLGPNIVAQIGKRPRGTAPLLTELLTGLKDTKGNTITSPVIENFKKYLSKAENKELDGLMKNQVATAKRFAAKNGIPLNSFAGVVDLSQSGLTMPPAVKNALNTIVKYGGKTLRGVGKGAIVLDPMFAAYDFSTAIDQGAGGKNASEYTVKRFGEGLLNLPDLVASGGKFVKDKLQGKDTKFEQGTLYEPFDFAQRGLEENLAAMPQSQKVRNIANRDFDVGIGASMGMVDDYQVPASRQEIEEERQKYLESQMGPYYKYGIESLPRKVAKPTRYDIKAKKVYNN
jgi:hypothetical protein